MPDDDIIVTSVQHAVVTAAIRQWRRRSQLVCRLAVDILNIIFSHTLTICRLVDKLDAKMCKLTLQMILLCNCLLSLNVCNIGLQCNLQFLSTTVLQGSVTMWVNDGGIFNDNCKFTAEYDGKRILKIG